MFKEIKMKTVICFLILPLFLSLIGLLTSCDDDSNDSASSTYIYLEYEEFMNESFNSIADSFAEILGVAPVLFNQKVSADNQDVSLGDNQWIKEGYEYTNANGANITVWMDHYDQPYVITYFLKRFGESDGWLYDQDEANSKVQTVLEEMGVSFDGTETLVSEEFSIDQDNRWYDISFTQTFQNESLAYPYIHAEVEGNNGEINFLKIHRWYYNLSEINKFLSDDEIKEIAVDYYKSIDEVISIWEDITCYGYYIVNDILCQRVGSAAIDEWDSYLDLYIDIQNGDIIDTESILVD